VGKQRHNEKTQFDEEKQKRGGENDQEMRKEKRYEEKQKRYGGKRRVIMNRCFHDVKAVIHTL
jgi:hypothetical protein